jgi:hypothetical protein
VAGPGGGSGAKNAFGRRDDAGNHSKPGTSSFVSGRLFAVGNLFRNIVEKTPRSSGNPAWRGELSPDPSHAVTKNPRVDPLQALFDG